MVKEFIPAIASMAGKNAAPIVRVSANQPDLGKAPMQEAPRLFL